MPDPLGYKPNIYSTTSLNQTKVECTWDETPRDRLAITMKKYTEDELKKSDFKHVLASSSEEESGDEEENGEENLKKSIADAFKKSTKTPEVEEDKSKDEEQNKIDKYRALLLGVQPKIKKTREADLQFSWGNGIEEDGDESLDELVSESANSSK